MTAFHPHDRIVLVGCVVATVALELMALAGWLA